MTARGKTTAVMFGILAVVSLLLFLPRLAASVLERNVSGRFEGMSELAATLPDAGVELELARNLYINHRYLALNDPNLYRTVVDYDAFLADVAALKGAGVLPEDYFFADETSYESYPFTREFRSGAVTEVRWVQDGPADLKALGEKYREYLGADAADDWEETVPDRNDPQSCAFYSPSTCLYVLCSARETGEGVSVFLSVSSMTNAEYYEIYP